MPHCDRQAYKMSWECAFGHEPWLAEPWHSRRDGDWADMARAQYSSTTLFLSWAGHAGVHFGAVHLLSLLQNPLSVIFVQVLLLTIF
jgi:hypothetical protein